eukprot:gene41608-55164_t
MSAVAEVPLNPLPPPASPSWLQRLSALDRAQRMRLGAGVALLVAAALWVARQPMFAIRSIQLEGDVTRNSLATIRTSAATRLAGSFFTLDLQAARSAFEAVPWVRQAVVQREFPNRLRVTLQEHQAV